MSTLTELSLSARLQALVGACQKVCVAECCGVEAFDFSPLHVASFLSAFIGRVDDDEAAVLQRELDTLLEQVSNLRPDENGLVCSIAAMNQCFTSEAFRDAVRKLKRSIAAAPEMVELSDRLGAGGA